MGGRCIMRKTTTPATAAASRRSASSKGENMSFYQLKKPSRTSGRFFACEKILLGEFVYTLRMSVPHAKTTPNAFDANAAARALDFALDTLQIEADAILAIKNRLAADGSHAFSRAVELLLQCDGRVVVSGIGKSGHIGRKIAATLASTGTP